MNNQLITAGNNTINLVEETLNLVNDCVTATMGSNGKLALIGVGTSAKVTKDGVTVARSIKFEDPRQELINRVITEPSIKTDEECGDGTTTTVFLTHQLYQVLTTYPSFKDQKYTESIVQDVIEQLSDDSIRVEMDSDILKSLALTSSNNDVELSTMVTDIYKNSEGKFPEIEIKEGIDPTDRISRSSGLSLQMNFSNPGFSKSGNGDDTTYEQPTVVMIDSNVKPIDSDNLFKGLKHLSKDSNKTYLLVARSFENDVNVMISQVNNQLGRNVFIPIQTNMGGSVGTLLMQDLATLFNTKLLKSVNEIEVNDFNASADSVVVGNTRSLFNVLTDETRSRINDRVELIQGELNDYEGGERFSHRARFNETRIRNLNGELVTIFVGGQTISDVKERVDRFEDVIKAVKSALVNGVLPGMGTALILAFRKVVEKYEHELEVEAEELGESLLDGLFQFGDNRKRIIKDLGRVMCAQHEKLIDTATVAPGRLIVARNKNDANIDNPYWAPICVNLTNDEIGTAEELGIYDTAYASITALKGGFKTAKILANLDSVLLGDKLGAIKIN